MVTSKKMCAWCDRVVAKLYGVRVAGQLSSVCKKCRDMKERERGF